MENELCHDSMQGQVEHSQPEEKQNLPARWYMKEQFSPFPCPLITATDEMFV